jgi:hypothetical protein
MSSTKIVCSVPLYRSEYPIREPQIGDFVVLANGFFGPVVTRDGQRLAIAPLNEIPDDEYPATLDDVIWIAPEYVKVSIRFVRDVDSQKRE